MSFKRLLILGGAALLVAGCALDSTSPIRKVDGSSSVRGKKPGGVQTMDESFAGDSASCRKAWPVSVGIIGDSSCTSEP